MDPLLVEGHPEGYIDIFNVITIFQRVKPGTVQLLYMAKEYCNLARYSSGGKLYTFKDQVKVSIFEVGAQTEDTSCVMSNVGSEVRTLAPCEQASSATSLLWPLYAGEECCDTLSCCLIG